MSGLAGEPVSMDVDETLYLSEDEEGERNRVGNVDLSLYEDEEHVGYDVHGQRIEQVFKLKDSEIDNLLRYADDPEAWRKVVDVKNQSVHRITDTELEIIRRLKEGRLGITGDINEEDYQVEFEWYDNKQPLRQSLTRKGKFLPGRGEEAKIQALVRAIRAGKVCRVDRKRRVSAFDLWGDCITVAYDKKGRPILPTLPAPKAPLPTHAESYNPSPEFLFDDEERKAWEEAHPADRRYNFVPQAFKSLRQVPAYPAIIEEQYNRCLDLYLCPRVMRLQWMQGSESILPQLPPLDNFKPFPRTQGITVKDQGSPVTSLSFCRQSGVLAGGYRDGSLAIHNMSSKPHYLPEFYAHSRSQSNAYAITSLAFHPILPLMVLNRGHYLYICLVRRPQTSFVALRDLVQRTWGAAADLTTSAKRAKSAETTASDNTIDLSDIPKGLHQYVEALDVMKSTAENIPLANATNAPHKVGQWRAFRCETFFEGYEEPELGDDEGSIDTEGEDEENDGATKLHAKDWNETLKFINLLSKKNKYFVAGYVVSLGAKADAVSIHPKGAYVATAASGAAGKTSQCLLHHIKKKASLAPFKKTTGLHQVEAVGFHPTKPYLIVGYPKVTRIFDLQPRQRVHIAAKPEEANKAMAQVVRKLKGTNQATAMEIHPNGNHIIRTGIDGKFQWFDCEYSDLPYKTIPVTETGSLTAVKHHPYLPLVAAGTSESEIQLFHAAEDDFTEVAITPLVRLADRKSHITALAWSPYNHWLASGHSDGRMVVWV